MKVVAIVSGGMDSVTMAWLLKDLGADLHLLSFDYGQRHVREVACAASCALDLGARHHIIQVPLGGLIGTSVLTGDVPVPDGHYAEDSMKATVVPNRNLVMLSLAAAVAVAEEAEAVAIGVHGGDHFIYPDCRPEFISSADATLRIATLGHAHPRFRLLAPFLYDTKADIVRAGDLLGVPWKNTWSCYRGGDEHCGACGTCYERREAFKLADVPDPTAYAARPTYPDPR